MEKGKKHRFAPKRKLFLLRTLFILLFAFSLTLFIVFALQSQDQNFFGAKIVQEENIFDNPGTRKSRRFELNDIPLTIFSGWPSAEEKIPSGTLPARLSSRSFGVKKTFVPAGALVTEEDLSKAYNDLYSALLGTILSEQTNDEVFAGIVQNSVVIHFQGSTVPVGEETTSFDYGIDGNIEVILIRYKDLYSALEDRFGISSQEIFSTGLKPQTMNVRRSESQYEADIILISEATELPSIVVP